MSLTARLLDHAVRVMPPSRVTWARAMRAELDHIEGPLTAAAFALGCVRASYAERIHDMLTIARLTRWTLAVLALAWAGFGALAAVLLIAIKTRADIRPVDLGTDPGVEQTLAFIQSYPAWEVGAIGLTAALLTFGAVQLARRRRLALPLLALSVGLATALALFDLRLSDPGSDRPMDSAAGLLIPLLCLIPVWWLSRRAPDLTLAS
jgi:hypothetical protein